MNQKGFSAGSVIIVLFILVATGAAYFAFRPSSAPTEVPSRTNNIVNSPLPQGALPAGCIDKPEGEPVITSISKTSGPVGTKVEIIGCNFAGFEGDKTVWIQNNEGVKGILAGDPGSTAKLLKLTLRSPLCQKDNSYSGLPCEAWLNLVPGTYKIYTEPWGKRSNEISFTIQ